ncbi:MAG: hypothetical protein A2V73_07430 [candidate division Zixibacteria bacterium RBG_19FT_COMBO_42_43]|nr:MAG: hypothetical protein A2V73_07430 [candidate division Zixibacteria bacterium RBG_19FT_COMBO_42_43]
MDYINFTKFKLTLFSINIILKCMSTYPEKEIKKLNDLLQDLLGFAEEAILTRQKDNSVYVLTWPETLDILKNCSTETLDKLYKILHFYYPRWTAYNAIQKSDYRYRDFASNNELLLALTSIVDWLANRNNDTRRWTNRFIRFINDNLDEEEIKRLVTNFYVAKESGKKEKLNSKEDLADYIYEVRSRIVHHAELGGLYPFQADFYIDFEKGRVGAVCYMITPKDFRLFLWKAIFNSLGLKIIALPHKVLPKNETDKQVSYFL